jgi:hypothetical protein
VCFLAGWSEYYRTHPFSIFFTLTVFCSLYSVCLVALSFSSFFLDSLPRPSISCTLGYALKFGKISNYSTCIRRFSSPSPSHLTWLFFKTLFHTNRSLIHPLSALSLALFSLFFFPLFPPCFCVAISTYGKHGHKWVIFCFSVRRTQ